VLKFRCILSQRNDRFACIFSFRDFFWEKIVERSGIRHFLTIQHVLNARELKSEVDKRLEAGGNGLVNDEDYQGAEYSLEIQGGGDEKVHGPFF
jgi:hypothetical protein